MYMHENVLAGKLMVINIIDNNYNQLIVVGVVILLWWVWLYYWFTCANGQSM